MTTNRLPDLKCPLCEADLGEATGVNTIGAPTRGDAGICFSCGSLMIFDDNLKLRPPTPLELEHYSSNRAVRRVMEEFRKKGKSQ